MKFIITETLGFIWFCVTIGLIIGVCNMTPRWPDAEANARTIWEARL
jgi:hypothetical protein